MKKILFLASLVTLLMTSCGDSFFDLEPASKVTIDKVYKTASDYNVAVVGCYAKLQSQVDFYKECCEYRSDNMEVKAPTAGTQDRYDINHLKISLQMVFCLTTGQTSTTTFTVAT